MKSPSAALGLCLLFVASAALFSCGGGGSSSSPGPPGPSPASAQAVVVGQTSSADFPTLAAVQASNAGGVTDGFVAEFGLPGGGGSPSQFRFSTYWGGSDLDQVRDAFVDDQGNVYFTGRTSSTDLQTTPGAFQRSFQGGPQDAFVVKMNRAGQLLFASYLGGSGYDVGYSPFVDSAGFIYVSGRTSSADFPVTAAAFQTIYGGGQANLAPYFGGDFFVVKMRPDGSGLVWGTYVGGSGDDTARGRLTVDADGSVYVGGVTQSVNFPVAAGILQGVSDGMVVKLSGDGQQLLFATYLGGHDTGVEGATGAIAVNAARQVYVCGSTSAPDFPLTSGPGLAGINDAFVARLSPGGQILNAVLLGGSGTEDCGGLALDSGGNPVLMGNTDSANFATTPGAYRTTAPGGADFYLAKLSPDLSTRIFSTYVGSPGNESQDASARVEFDASGNILFSGNTDSRSFPVTANALQGQYGGGANDGFVVRLSADGSQLLYATYLGGSGSDFSRALCYQEN